MCLVCDLIELTWLLQSETCRRGGRSGRGRKGGAGQQDMPETANALSLRASRAVTSASPTLIRLSSCPFGFT